MVARCDEDALRRRLPLMELSVTVGGRGWRLMCVQDQDALVEQVESEEDLQNFPYGLTLWAAALGLAEAVAEDPAVRSLAAGRRVLELGCGVGLAGLVARAQAGASAVVQTDYLDDALRLSAWNARLNDLADGVTVCKGDWRAFPAELAGYDLVIGSDILYERTLHDTLAQLLPRLVAPGGVILISDPMRPQALEWIERQEKSGRWRIGIDSRTVRFEGEPKEIALFRLERSGV